jgi:hypothetical protein
MMSNKTKLYYHDSILRIFNVLIYLFFGDGPFKVAPYKKLYKYKIFESWGDTSQLINRTHNRTLGNSHEKIIILWYLRGPCFSEPKVTLQAIHLHVSQGS